MSSAGRRSRSQGGSASGRAEGDVSMAPADIQTKVVSAAEPARTAPRQLFDRESLASYLRLSTDTIDRLVKAGRLPCVRIGSQVRFTREDVETFIAQHRQLGSAASCPRQRAVPPVERTRVRVNRSAWHARANRSGIASRGYGGRGTWTSTEWFAKPGVSSARATPSRTPRRW